MVSERIVWQWIRDVENLVENLEVTQKTGECLPTEEVLALKVLVRQIARDMRKTLQDVVRKTNKDWYPYEEHGCFYKLENGVLWQCPMNVGGTRDDSPCVVDMGWAEDLPRMKEIVRELRKRQ